MRGRKTANGTVFGEYVDRAPIGQSRHHELGDTSQRVLVVEGRREQRARLAKKREPLLGGMLCLERPGVIERESDSVGDQLEQANILLSEVLLSLRAHMCDADHPILDDERDRDQRLDTVLAENGADQVDLAQVVDEPGIARRRDATGETLAQRNRHRLAHLVLVKADGDAHDQTLTGLVEEEDRGGIPFENLRIRSSSAGTRSPSEK